MYALLAFRWSMTRRCSPSFLWPWPAACGGMEDDRAGLACVDDSKDYMDEAPGDARAACSPTRKKPAVKDTRDSASACFGRSLASPYRTQKKDLNCDELAAGRREADSRMARAAGPDAKGLSPLGVPRASMFAAEVSKELTAEECGARRCKA